jgi:NAD(P)-dependent dehydrogenase (short-subunit alcohol dehydrogenase family)
MRLSGKSAVVTGGGGALGSAILRAFAAEGAATAALDRDEAALALADLPDGTARIPCDVADADSVDVAVAAARAALGPIDVLVNNAGIAITGGVEDISEADWDRTFAVNVKSVFLLSRRILPDMRARRNGSIVNVASESAFIGFAMHPAYCASKAAMVHLSRSMANAHAADGIRVNALCPGTIDTPLYRRFLAQQPDPESVHATVVAMHPLGLGTPEDIAHAAVYLASDESRYMTGSAMLVDGGATAV